MSDLSHLEDTCVDTLSCGLDAVIAEVEQMERDGTSAPTGAPSMRGAGRGGGARRARPRGPGSGAEAGGQAEPHAAETAAGVPPKAVTPEEAIEELKRKIERLGPVNMMAIEQYDELDVRHAFLTGQRKDLIESIAATAKRSRRSTRPRASGSARRSTRSI